MIPVWQSNDWRLENWRARSDSVWAQRAGRPAGFLREAKRENPCHCAVCWTLFEPGSPGGNPANALGFPSASADRPAHRVLGGVPVLRVLAQKKLPHHVHGRGSQLARTSIATLTQAVPRCKPFSASRHAPPAPNQRRYRQSSRRHPLAAAMLRYYRSGRALPARAGEPPRSA